MAFFGIRLDSASGPTGRRLRAVWARLRPLARRAWHPLSAAAILGVAFVVLGTLHFAAGRQLQESSRRVVTARLALSRPAPQANQLTLALREWEFVLIAARSSRVAPLLDTDLVGRTLNLAESAGVAVVDAGTRPEFIEEIDGRPYRAVPYVVKARGSLPAIETFLHAMERGVVDTLEVRGSVVTRDGDAYVLSVSSVVFSHLPETGAVGGDDAAQQSAPQAVSATAGGGQR